MIAAELSENFCGSFKLKRSSADLLWVSGAVCVCVCERERSVINDKSKCDFKSFRTAVSFEIQK
jgi:hypothetical protein